MKNILLAILIVISFFHIIRDLGSFEVDTSLIKVAAQDEDSKNEKEEKKNSKQPYEEMYYHTIIEYSLLNTSVNIGSLGEKKPYYALPDEPNTPPPDFI